MGVKNKNTKLRVFFIQYLLSIFAGFLLIILIGIGLSFILLKTGFIISVGDVEESIERQKSAIMTAKTVTEELIPKTCKYAVISTSGDFLSGNLTKFEAAEARNIIEDGRRTSGIGLSAECYFPIKRQKEICILKYSAMSQFSSDFFRNHFLAPGIVFFYGILASVFIEIIFLSRFYGRKISRKLIPLQDATKKIQNKDLEFEVQYSGILEIDETLSSIDRMKDELKKSLETQWKIEQARKMQISALAHDIKTPLTVIFGNGEMLNDTEQTEEQKEFTNYILKNAHQIEEYVQILIDLSKAEIGYSLQRQDVDMRTFLDELYSQINAIASLKQLKVEFEEKNLPDVINLDTSLMQRAIMNVVSNAVDYSKEGGSILVSISVKNRKVRFIVYDNGKGFSMEALKNATKQFYQEDFSRSSKLHYGMGLYIADSIVKQHGGRLTVANSPVTGGGMVTLEF